MSSVFQLGNNGEGLGAGMQNFIPKVCGLGMGHEGGKGKKNAKSFSTSSAS